MDMLQAYASHPLKWADVDVDVEGGRAEVRFRDLFCAQAMVEELQHHQRQAVLLSK